MGEPRWVRLSARGTRPAVVVAARGALPALGVVLALLLAGCGSPDPAAARTPTAAEKAAAAETAFRAPGGGPARLRCVEGPRASSAADREVVRGYEVALDADATLVLQVTDRLPDGAPAGRLPAGTPQLLVDLDVEVPAGGVARFGFAYAAVPARDLVDEVASLAGTDDERAATEELGRRFASRTALRLRAWIAAGDRRTSTTATFGRNRTPPIDPTGGASSATDRILDAPAFQPMTPGIATTLHTRGWLPAGAATQTKVTDQGTSSGATVDGKPVDLATTSSPQLAFRVVVMPRSGR